MHRVVISGIGWRTSLGPDAPSTWRRLLEGESGIAPISFWDPAEYSAKVAAEVREVPVETGLAGVPASACRRGVRLFLPVVQEAFGDAKLDQVSLPPAQIGIAAGASVNYLNMSLLRLYYKLRRPDMSLDVARLLREGATSQDAFYRGLGDMMVSIPARRFQLAGPAMVLDTACAASAHAIGQAFRLVQRGRVRAMIAGGSAALVSPLSILAFSLLGALSRRANPNEASRPFDRLRDGFVMGEGAGAVVLESLESARERGARIYAEVAGYGSTLNSHNLTDPSPDGCVEARAISQALDEARLPPEEIGFVAAHGTSTPKNDVVETMALKQVFGAHAKRLLVSSNKGQIGHTISAAGVSNLICAVKAIAEGMVPPTMNLKNFDPACDLDYVANRSRRTAVRAALANAFAFGGQNAVLAVKSV